MKAFLMHRDRDFDLGHELPANEEALTQDLELNTLFVTMAGGDPFLFEVAKRALLLSLRDTDTIVNRQEVLTDCLENPSLVRELYALAGEAIKAERSIWGFADHSPRSTLGRAVQKMEFLVAFLRRLCAIADEHAAEFRSPGFRRFFAMLDEELDDGYFNVVEGYLKELKFKGGMLLSAQLSAGNKGKNHMLRRARVQGWLGRAFDRSGYSFTIPERDESGFRALGELEDKAQNLVANALAQSVEHVLSFFVMLRIEIGFYVACVNLSERLADNERATGGQARAHLPPGGACTRWARPLGPGLYDVCLTLTVDQRVVGNDVDADHKSLVMITGANQGGKSTFLRSVGLAQLMLQCGMFVGGESFRANVCGGLFTHCKREEDEAMESGKLDEELARMSEIADQITPNCVLLCNESFAATNEREGSAIARQVIHALLQEEIRVLFVSHMFDLADGFYREAVDASLFLRAERGSDGARPFKLVEGNPLPTSYGEDSYRKIFGRNIDAAAAAPPALPPYR